MTEKHWTDICERFDGQEVSFLVAIDWLLTDRDLPTELYENYIEALVKQNTIESGLTEEEINRILIKIIECATDSEDLSKMKFLIANNVEELEKAIRSGQMVLVRMKDDHIVGVKSSSNRLDLIGFSDLVPEGAVICTQIFDLLLPPKSEDPGTSYNMILIETDPT